MLGKIKKNSYAKIDPSEIGHILAHLEDNQIHSSCPSSNDYYFGNKNSFIKRHKKLIKILHEAVDNGCHIIVAYNS